MNTKQEEIDQKIDDIIDRVEKIFNTAKNFIRYLKSNQEIRKAKYKLDEPTFSHIRNKDAHPTIIKTFISFWEKHVVVELSKPEELEEIRHHFSGRQAKNTFGLERYFDKSFWVYVYPVKGSTIEISTLHIDINGQTIIKNPKATDNGEASDQVDYTGKITNGTKDTIFILMDSNDKDKPLFLRFYKSKGDKVSKIMMGAYFKIENNRIMVGSIIIELEEDEILIRKIKSSEFYNNHILKSSQEIHPHILDFFRDKDKNIIKLPESINDTKTLGEWITQKRQKTSQSQNHQTHKQRNENFKYEIFFAFPMTNPPRGWIERVNKYIFAISKFVLNIVDKVDLEQKVFFHTKNKPIQEDYIPSFDPIGESRYFIMFIPNEKTGSFLVEAGYAYGCKKPSIYLVQKNCLSTIPTILQKISDSTIGMAKIITYEKESELESPALFANIKRELNGLEEKISHLK